MIQFLVCEDDPALLDYMTQKIKDTLVDEHITYGIKAYESSSILLKEMPYLETQLMIALLDIDIDREGDGFRIAKKLRRLYGNEVTIIFLTSYSDYVFECFDYEPFGFIRKKYLETELEGLIHRAMSKVSHRQKLLTFIKTSVGEVKLRENDIMFLEKDGKNVRISTIKNSFEVSYQLSELQDMLPTDRFLMIYRSVVVNMDYVVRVEKDQVVLENGMTLPLSRYRVKQVKEVFQLQL